MDRAALALLLFVVFTAVGFGWRTAVQVRHHGDSGWRFSRQGLDRVVGPALVVGVVLVGAGPVIALLGTPPTAGGATAAVLGTALALGAGGVTIAAQVQMGASWRVGVEEGERTDLVTSGLFSQVRNPIFTGMVLFCVGLALLVPNLPTVLGAVVAVVAIEVQVRLVEEPHLLGLHGDAYRRWAATTGRFVPGIGRGL